MSSSFTGSLMISCVSETVVCTGSQLSECCYWLLNGRNLQKTFTFAGWIFGLDIDLGWADFFTLFVIIIALSYYVIDVLLIYVII